MSSMMTSSIHVVYDCAHIICITVHIYIISYTNYTLYITLCIKFNDEMLDENSVGLLHFNVRIRWDSPFNKLGLLVHLGSLGTSVPDQNLGRHGKKKIAETHWFHTSACSVYTCTLPYMHVHTWVHPYTHTHTHTHTHTPPCTYWLLALVHFWYNQLGQK